MVLCNEASLVEENKENSYEQMKAIAHTYASNWECSVQEAVYDS